MQLNKDFLTMEPEIAQTDSSVITKYVLSKTNNASHRGITRLRDVFSLLPPGLVYKDETAMGATYLELEAKRNSIVVEPIKVTASSKAKKHGAFYVGSETKYHPKRITNDDIKAYLTSGCEFKKIVVVADSLYKVISAIGNDVYKDFFLLIDEIDSFQMDASFRSSMEAVMDIYKKFPSNMRSMVSATPLEFSDPELAKEPITYISYDSPTKREIDLFYTENIQGAIIKKISDLLEKNPNDKVMVAFNSVSGCYDIIKHLISNGIINAKDVKLLCSSNSRRTVEEYYVELESDILPARLNFVTSAYFTGFDLNEDYHLISVSSNENSIYCLSDKRLKQIAGRCRHKLLSETVIYDLVPFYEELKHYTVEDLIKAAVTEIKSLDCIKRNFFSNDILQQSYDKIRDLIIEHTKSGEHAFVRNKGGEPVISYLNIDAKIESNRVQRELYCNVDEIEIALKNQGHIVKSGIIETTINVEEANVSKEERKRQVEEVVELLQNLPFDKEPIELMNKKGMSLLQKDFMEAYHYTYKSIDKEQLLSMMSEAMIKDRRSFNNLTLAAYYATLHPDEQYKRIVRHYIPIGSTVNNEDLIKKWNDIFSEMGTHTQLTSETKVVRLTKLHYKLTKRRDKNKKVVGHFIKSDNPYDFKIIACKPIVNHQTEINFIFKRLF
jgi:hypothetical protein